MTLEARGFTTAANPFARVANISGFHKETHVGTRKYTDMAETKEVTDDILRTLARVSPFYVDLMEATL